MPKRIERLGWADAGGPIMLIDDQHRIAAEKAYGRKIPDEAWISIVLKTAVFGMIASTELTPSLSDVFRRIERIRSDATTLRRMFTSSAQPALRDSLDDIARVYFQMERRSVDDNDIFIILQHALGALIQVSSFTLVSLSQPDHSAAADHEGSAWASWIKAVTQIMRERALPIAIRKDGGDTSAFARLIFELQKSFPKNLQRHMPDEVHEMTTRIGLDGLSQAITRARRRTFPPTLIDISPADIVTFFRVASSVKNES
jgi:hypothetical protein